MKWDEIDFNSILIIVGAICIGILKLVEMWKSGSYRSTKLINSKEEMKQVEALKTKYREKLKKEINNVKKVMLDKIENKQFNSEFENILDRLTELYSSTNNLITSRSNSEDLMKNEEPENNKLIELKETKQRSRMQSCKEDFAEKIKTGLLKRLSEQQEVEIDMED